MFAGPLHRPSGKGESQICQDLEEAAKFVAVDARVAQNARERASLEFAMQRHHQRNRALRMLEADMAAALSNRNPPHLAERRDELGAGNDRQPLAHAGSASLRRTIPMSRD